MEGALEQDENCSKEVFEANLEVIDTQQKSECDGHVAIKFSALLALNNLRRMSAAQVAFCDLLE